MAGEVRQLLSTYREAEDLINIGAYVKGSSKKIDRAIEKFDAINDFLRQRQDELIDHDEAVQQLRQVINGNKA